ncbi:MAG: hypothetical protein FVQ82_06195 [Planctomycetes bacterium]|nr:hypothetical protein [Planctomycetota bacterium]
MRLRNMTGSTAVGGGLVKASPKGFDVVSEFKIEKGEGVHWAHPAISDGVLYIRHVEFLMAYDIKKSN